MEERLVELEIRYTHLEQQILELNQVVFAQQKLMDGLAKQLTAIVGRMGQFAETPPGEKPPHY
jgi:uncharacterized coiled-coil protein SlyX